MYAKLKVKSYKTDYRDTFSALIVLLDRSKWCNAFLAFETAKWRWN